MPSRSVIAISWRSRYCLVSDMSALLATSALLGLFATQTAANDPAARAVPAQSLPSLISNEDYPAEALRRNEQGTVSFRLDVGVDGRVSGCSILQSSGSTTLDATTCRIIRSRARFRPARDTEGRPTPDRFESKLLWSLSNNAPPQLRAATSLWQSCVFGEAAKLAIGELSSEQVVARAFPPCAALEAMVERHVGAAALIGARKEWANRIGAELPKIRDVFRQPPRAGPPGKQ